MRLIPVLLLVTLALAGCQSKAKKVQELQKQVAKLGADLAAAKATDPKTPEPPKDAKPQ